MTTHNRSPRPVVLSFPTTPGRRRAPARFTYHLGPCPPLRMPSDGGGFLVEAVDTDPAGGLSGFTASWHPQISPTDTQDGDLILQLLTPTEPRSAPAEHDDVDAALWIARTGRWALLRRWQHVGAGWPHHVAPWIHAALPTPPRAGHPSGRGQQPGATPRKTWH